MLGLQVDCHAYPGSTWVLGIPNPILTRQGKHLMRGAISPFPFSVPPPSLWSPEQREHETVSSPSGNKGGHIHRPVSSYSGPPPPFHRTPLPLREAKPTELCSQDQAFCFEPNSHSTQPQSAVCYPLSCPVESRVSLPCASRNTATSG